MINKRVKMVDVARAANVSRTTVSLILNQIPGVRIAETTRQRVLATARELGYSPGPSLHDLAPDRTQLFGVLINEISSAYPIDLLYELQNWADTQGVQLITQVTGGLADHETAALDNLSRLGVGGLIYATTFTTLVSPPPALDRFRHVLLNCRRENGAGFAVLPAELDGGALATRHLLDLGRRRIATITGDPWQIASMERLAGFHEALRSVSLSPTPPYERTGDWSHASGYAAAGDLLNLSNPPDAIFCQNDLMARGAMAAIRDAGLSVPEDIALIGYDDREFARDIGLSSIAPGYAEMAETAMATLTGAATLGDSIVSVPGMLIPRLSTLGPTTDS